MKFKQYLNEFKQNAERKWTFKSKESLLDNILNVITIGQNVERSYEDREVFTEIWLEHTKENPSVTHGGVDNKITTWLRGEDAIKLGQQFINSGNEALENNRNNAYEIIQLLGAKEDINRGKYSRLIITKKLNIRPPNHGEGFYYYDLLYVSNNDMSSRLIEDVVIYWSPFEDEFNEQLKHYSNGLAVDKIGWSFKQIKDDFDKAYKEQFGVENKTIKSG